MARNTSTINKVAGTVFASVLPDTWRSVVDHPDERHIDFAIYEKTDDGDDRPSGVQCLVQVKGSDSPRRTAKGHSKAFEREHLEYWIDRCPEPVFLILVDTTQKQAYYRFVHDWNDELGDSWRQVSEPTVEFPLLNRVDDSERFVADVRRAQEEMRRIRRLSFPVSASLELDRLSRIDDRFGYELAANRKETRITILAQRDVEAGLHVSTEEAARRLHELVRAGQPQQFNRGELHWSGGGIFDHWNEIARETTITLESTYESEIHIRFDATFPDGTTREILPSVRGKIRGGTHELRYECRVPGGALRFKGEVLFKENERRVAAPITISFHLTAWEGTPLRELAYFERVHTFFEGLGAASEIRMELEVNGQSAPTAPVSVGEATSLSEQAMPLLTVLRSMRNVAKKLEISPTLPVLSGLSTHELARIDHVIRLVSESRFTLEAPDLSVDSELKFFSGQQLSVDNLAHVRLVAVHVSQIGFFGMESAKYIQGSRIQFLHLSDACKEELASTLPSQNGVVRVELVADSTTIIEHVLGPANGDLSRLPFSTVEVGPPVDAGSAESDPTDPG